MDEKPLRNHLYFAVLPQIQLSGFEYGKVGQVLTLLPDRELATEFFPDEVENYVLVFRHRLSYFVGGHVTGYEIEKETTSDGRVVVRVTQNVQR